MTAPPSPTYALFGRRKGRRLRKDKSDLMETLLPTLQLPMGEALAPSTLFPNKKAVFIEIGFGGGEHLAAQAKANPAIGFIGAEPFVNGIASLLDHIHRDDLKNIRIFTDDARKLIDQLPDQSIATCFLLFSDPWPKKRHADRRFITPDNLEKLARVMTPHAELRVATDDPILQEWTITHLRASPHFVAGDGTDNGVLAPKPATWITTRYEQKGMKKGRTPIYYQFRRKS